MPQYDISSLDDPLLEPFRELRSRNWTEQSGVFVVEGPLLVEQLIDSSYGVQSILLDRKYLYHYAAMVPESVNLLLVEHALVEDIVGFNFHRGVLGCGLRKPVLTLNDSFHESTDPHETMVCAVGVQDPENLGGILRSCAALGIERVIMGPGTADPLSRRVLRVSMGTAFQLQIFRSRDLPRDLNWLRDHRGVTSVATTLATDAQPLETTHRVGPTLILIGNERYGLPAEIQAQADQRVTIAMDLGTDSLNVCVAAGIVMHYFCRIAGR